MKYDNILLGLIAGHQGFSELGAHSFLSVRRAINLNQGCFTQTAFGVLELLMCVPLNNLHSRTFTLSDRLDLK